MYTQWIQKPKEDIPEKTDLKNWRLEVDKGRQVWKYVTTSANKLQKVCEKYFLGLDIVNNSFLFHLCQFHLANLFIRVKSVHHYQNQIMQSKLQEMQLISIQKFNQKVFFSPIVYIISKIIFSENRWTLGQ